MPLCPSCSSEIPAGKRFCADCGTALKEPDDVTQTSPGGGTSSSTPASAPRTAAIRGESRFLPGSVVAERYRIVGLLGRGGMGEVYRADDLKLGQAVALKFLPESFTEDPERRERFLNEARVALQITHPNVCRVYDLGDVDGHLYLSMEYVDGEDLASLLRRIGRLPGDKAVEIARQICAGLGAAHDQGFLHRDLKPANVMLDGRGRVRITDLGLAGLEEAFQGGEVRVGTPAYMSPEQLEGKEVTIRSDLYALGLVMYELFTGKRTFSGDSMVEITRARIETNPASPSSLISDLDPASESIILRCLEKDPSNRPPSAMAVSAALPGGDPLAAALAAGETPSPELLAAAGEKEAMSPLLALAIAVLSVVLFAVGARLAARDDLQAYVPMDKTPEVMRDRAREIIENLGYTEPIYAEPADTAVGYSTWSNLLAYIDEHEDSPDRWKRLETARPGAVSFWYRQTPSQLFPSPRWGSVGIPPVGRWNPFPDTPGEILVSMDLRGELTFFAYTPKRYREDPAPDTEPDWRAVFELAGLDIDDFEPTESRYQRYVAPDRRLAWIGHLPEAPEFELRIEAGTLDGRVVLFGMLWPWELETVGRDPVATSVFRVDQTLGVLVFFGIVSAAIVLARRNLRGGRADRSGALRLMIAVLVLRFAYEILRAPAGLYASPVLGIFALASSLFDGVLAGALYVAVEPYARRIWPTILISWSRLVGGSQIRWRDPSVGRSILAGLAGGTLLTWTWPAGDAIRTAMAGSPLRPPIGHWEGLLGQRYVLAEIANILKDGALNACVIVLFLVLARFVVRRTTPAVVVVGVIAVIPTLLGADLATGEGWLAVALQAADIAISFFLLLRYGLIAAVIGQFVFPRLAVIAAAPDWSAWYARPAITTFVVLAAIAAYGYWAATRGRKLLPDADE